MFFRAMKVLHRASEGLGSGIVVRYLREGLASENRGNVIGHRADQHCHAMFADGLRCLKSNTEMIAVLQAELSRARSGAVSYSTNARVVLERELAARENYAKKPRAS